MSYTFVGKALNVQAVIKAFCHTLRRMYVKDTNKCKMKTFVIINWSLIFIACMYVRLCIHGGGFLAKFRVGVCHPQFQNGTIG